MKTDGSCLPDIVSICRYRDALLSNSGLANINSVFSGVDKTSFWDHKMEIKEKYRFCPTAHL